MVVEGLQNEQAIRKGVGVDQPNTLRWVSQSHKDEIVTYFWESSVREIFFVSGIITMRENKEKTVTSGDEDVAAPLVVPVTSVQGGKRKSKSISSAMDLDDLSSRRGAKKQKPVKTPIPKVLKFTPPTVNLDNSPVDVELVQTVYLVQTDLPPPSAKNSRKPSPFEPSNHPSNLVLDENYTWRTFKGIVANHEVNECYNMSVREFERFGIHDIFKVVFCLSLCVLCFVCLFYIYIYIYILTSIRP